MTDTPNLFIAGAPKCGTTTLYDHLASHPQIFMTEKKEPAFFDKDAFFDLAGNAIGEHWTRYLMNFPFEGAETARYFGDATPTMVFPKMATRIRQMCGSDVKIIISLRDPVDRAYSHYWHGYRLGLESGNPDKDLFNAEKPESVADTGRFPKHYVLTGRYWVHIDRFVSEFGRKNVLLLRFEDLISCKEYVMNDVWKFLNIPEISLNNIHSNPATVSRLPMLQRFFAGDSFLKSALKRIFPVSFRQNVVNLAASLSQREFRYPPISEELATRLADYYAADNQILKSSFGFNISGWR